MLQGRLQAECQHAKLKSIIKELGHTHKNTNNKKQTDLKSSSGLDSETKYEDTRTRRVFRAFNITSEVWLGDTAKK